MKGSTLSVSALYALVITLCCGACGSGTITQTSPTAVDSLAGAWNVEVAVPFGTAFYDIGGVSEISVPPHAMSIPAAPNSLALRVKPNLFIQGYEAPDYPPSCSLADQGCWLSWPTVPQRPSVIADTLISVQKAGASYLFTWQMHVFYFLYDQIPRALTVTWNAPDLSAQTWGDTTAAMVVRVTR